MHQALQVKDYRQAQLIAASQLGVKLTDTADSLAEQLALMKALPNKAGTKLFHGLLVFAVVNLSDAALNLQLLFKALVNDHPISPAHRLEDSYQVMPRKA